MKHGLGWAVFGMAVVVAPAASWAGLLDKLNEATKKMNEATQNMQQKNAQQQQQGAQGQYGGGSLSSALGATDLHGLTDYNNCLAVTNGRQEKLTAETLQRKLAQSPNLSVDERRMMQEDIAWLNAKAAGQQVPAPNPKDPQRYLLRLTDEEQMEINHQNMKFSREVHADCEEKYGGMSQFGSPDGRRGHNAYADKLRAENQAAEEEYQRAKNAPKQPTAFDKLRECGGMGLRWQLMAERMEQRFQAQAGLSAQDRKAWEEDIAVVRAAAQSGATTMPQSPDPANPMRYMTRLTTEDQVAMSQDYAARSQACTGAVSAGLDQQQAARNRARGEEIAERAKAQAQANIDAKATNEERRARSAARRAAAGGGGSLSAGLGATNLDYFERAGVTACYDPIKGHMAKVTADALEAKLKTASGLSTQQRSEWAQDIAAWRGAEQAGADEAVPPDLDNPYRWQDRLTRGERQQINQQHSAFVNKITAECNATDHMAAGASTRGRASN